MAEDLRSRRTKKHLMEAFDKAVYEKPVSKITVTSLAEAAEVSKQAFYLHYSDIYDIAEKWTDHQIKIMIDGMDFVGTFFSDPPTFVDGLFSMLRRNRKLGAVFFRDDVCEIFIPLFSTCLEERIAELQPPECNELQASVATTMLLGGLLALLRRYGEDNGEIAKVAGDVLARMGAAMRACEQPQQAPSSEIEPIA